MATVYLGLGSNKGDRLQYLKSAVRGIAEFGRTSVVKTSSVYETEPVGKKDQSEFLNSVIRIETTLAPDELLKELKSLERKLGRSETVRWGPREIDIDILYYDNVVSDVTSLRIPHAEIANRRFVLIPLCEVAPDLMDPVRRLTAVDLLRFCPDNSAVRRINLELDARDKSGKGPYAAAIIANMATQGTTVWCVPILRQT